MAGKRHIIISRVIGLLVLAILSAPVVVQIPAVQTMLLAKVTTLLESVLDGKIHVGSIQIKLGGALAVRDIVVEDDHPYTDDKHDWAPADTLAEIGLVTGTIRVKGLLKHEGIHLGRIHIQNVMFHLVSEPTDYKSNISRILKVKPAEAPAPQEKYPVFDIRRIRLDNVRFLMNNYIIQPKASDMRSPYGVHFEDMDATVEKLMVKNLRFAYGRMSGELSRCMISEKRGYRLDNLTAKFAVGSGLTTVTGLHLTDEWSDITINNFTMDYSKGAKAFMRFLTDVRLAVSTDNGGYLDIRTISGVCGALYGNESVYELKRIRAEGTIGDIRVRSLQFREMKTGLAGSLNCNLGGLPDIQKFTLDGDFRNVSFTPVTGCAFTAYWARGFKLHFPGEQKFLLNGSVHGLLSNLDIKVGMSSEESGDVAADLHIRNIQDSSGRPITLDCAVRSHDINAGAICGLDIVERVSLQGAASMVLTRPTPDFRVDSLKIIRLGFKGNDYTGISLRGFKNGDKILARLLSTDPGISFNILADCEGKPETGDLNLNLAADMKQADLCAMGLFKDTGTALVSASLNASLRSLDNNNVAGHIEIIDPVLTDRKGGHYIGDITAGLVHGDSDSIGIRSGVADIDFCGTAGPLQMIRDVKAITIDRELPAIHKGSGDDTRRHGSYHAAVDFHDCRELLAFIFPNAYIQDGTTVRVDADSCTVSATVASGRLAIGSNYLKGISLQADNAGGRLRTAIDIDEIKAAGLELDKSSISAQADSNDFSVGMRYAVKGKDSHYGNLGFVGNVHKNDGDMPMIKVMPSGASLTIGGEEWKWAESEITLGGGKIRFRDFNISSEGKSLRINGGVSRETRDSLMLEMDGIGLDIIKKINDTWPDIEGTLSGHASLISPLHGKYRAMGKIRCDSLSVNGSQAGDITLAVKWDDIREAISIYLEDEVEGRKALTSYTYVKPEDNSINAEATLDRMSTSIVMPFLQGVLDNTGGAVSGTLKAEGPLKDLSVTTDGIALDDVSLTLSATGVSYVLNGQIDINDKGLVLDGVRVRDGTGGKGKLSGIIDLRKLDKLALDAGLDFNDLLFIDCTEKAGQSFYGNLAGTGTARIKGPLSRLDINARVTTSGEGSVHIPLGSSMTSVNSDLLTFVQKKKEMDDYEAMISSMKEEKTRTARGDISINADINVTPDMKAVIEIDKSTGNVLSANGEGSIKAQIRPAKGILNLDGIYRITGGNYHFRTAAIISKEFTIQSGSSLNFNGPVKDSRLDVSALYKLKTSLNTLIADSTSVNSRRPVECGIRISETLSNLHFGFSINVPDLDPTTKAMVDNALNTEDKVQKQFASLLVLGTFLPSEQSGVVNSRNVLYSNVSEVMTGQINSIFQKLDIPVDLGFGYQKNDGGTDIFDVAISTQLFNNRVIINGSVGNRKYTTSSNPYGDVVGDLDIDIKLDKKGRLRAKLFSHSADQYTSFLDYSQRNGLGVSYQLEYDKLKYLFKPAARSHSDSLKVIRVEASDDRHTRASAQSSPASSMSR